ncbi:MAG: PilZ domain-containing protein [Candidatus Omnitrophota bacterium]
MEQRSSSGRRQYERVKEMYLVCYRAKLGENKFTHYFYTLTKDISAGGMMIMAEEKFARGTELEIIIRLPMYPDKKIDARGEVRGLDDDQTKKMLYKTRVRFIDFDEYAFEKLKIHIDQKMNKKVDGGIPLRAKLDRRKYGF